MNLKINYHYIYIFLFTSFFFLWDVNILDLKNFNISQIIGYKFITLNYFIILLLLPIFYLLSRKKNLSIYKIFNNQKYIILFVSFVIFHYFFTNILYHQIIAPYELLNLFFLIILSFIYCHYRNFLSNNFGLHKPIMKPIIEKAIHVFIHFLFQLIEKDTMNKNNPYPRYTVFDFTPIMIIAENKGITNNNHSLSLL